MKAFWRGVASIGEGMGMIGAGMASLMDLSGPPARIKLGGPDDDAEAIRKDWEAVGQDLWRALDAMHGDVHLSRDKQSARRVN